MKLKTVRLLPLLFALGMIAACGGNDETPTPVAAVEAPAATPTAAPASAPAAPAPELAADAMEAIRAAMVAQTTAMPMRMSMENEGELTTVEVVDANTIQMSSPGFGFILVDGKSFVKEGDVWTENPQMASMAAMVAKNFDTSEVEKSLALVTGASQLPDEELNGESTRVYQFTSDVTGDGSMMTTSKIWVRDSDGLPVQVQSSDDEGTSVTMRYEYDPGIVVEAPPVAAP